MSIDHQKFFAGVRGSPMPRRLTQGVVDTFNDVLDEYERRGMNNLPALAYIFATIHGECYNEKKNPGLLPVREGFYQSDSGARAFVKRQGYRYAKEVNGHVYYGRGYVQLTWADNYKTMGKRLKIDLYNEPDLALEPKIAVMILFEGMVYGLFTKYKLSDFFNEHKADWIGARKIINGTDRADKFAGLAKQYYTDLIAAQAAAQ